MCLSQFPMFIDFTLYFQFSPGISRRVGHTNVYHHISAGSDL